MKELCCQRFVAFSGFKAQRFSCLGNLGLAHYLGTIKSYDYGGILTLGEKKATTQMAGLPSLKCLSWDRNELSQSTGGILMRLCLP